MEADFLKKFSSSRKRGGADAFENDPPFLKEQRHSTEYRIATSRTGSQYMYVKTFLISR
jgi:hypothetical protein